MACLENVELSPNALTACAKLARQAGLLPHELLEGRRDQPGQVLWTSQLIFDWQCDAELDRAIVRARK